MYSRKPEDPSEQLTKRLRTLYSSIHQWKNADGAQPIGVFLEKPSRKDYPDYYDIISDPISMNEIDDKIRDGRYRTEEEFIGDCKLMFDNCRIFNEEGSLIVQDADALEAILLEEAKKMGVGSD